MISTTQLAAIFPQAAAHERLPAFVQPINDALDRFSISTPRRQAAFLAQCAHESAELLYLREIATGDAYEGRADLGNIQPGDGRKFKGGGLIQITGRDNYTRCGAALGLDLVNNPDLIVVPENACAASAWWWQTHGLNEFADTESFGTICHKVNGGYNGLDARIRYYICARGALGL